jgi:hypothetical protein
MMGYYILDDQNQVKEVEDVVEWGKWFAEEGRGRRTVKQDHSGQYFISTVFLGIDHNFLDTGKPLVFESMVFDENQPREIDMGRGRQFTVYEELFQDRYTTYEEALKAHERLVEEYAAK